MLGEQGRASVERAALVHVKVLQHEASSPLTKGNIFEKVKPG